MLFVRQILSLDFKQDCEHCILSLKKQEMTCVTEVHYIVVGRGAKNLETYLLLCISFLIDVGLSVDIESFWMAD